MHERIDKAASMNTRGRIESNGWRGQAGSIGYHCEVGRSLGRDPLITLLIHFDRVD